MARYGKLSSFPFALSSCEIVLLKGRFSSWVGRATHSGRRSSNEQVLVRASIQQRIFRIF
jgi:hypothetical protein